MQYNETLSENLHDTNDSFYTLKEDLWREHWSDIQGQLKEKWPKLTHSDLDTLQNDQEKLTNLIKERYQLTHQQVHKQVDAFYKHLSETL